MLTEQVGPFLHWLRERGYARHSVDRYRASAKGFAAHVDRRALSLQQVTPQVLEGYAHSLARRFRRSWSRPMSSEYREQRIEAVRPFLRYLAAQGVLTHFSFRQRQDLCAVPGYERLMTEYGRFLRCHRGLSPGTIEVHLRHMGDFCRKALGLPPDLGRDLTPSRIYHYLSTRAERLGPVSLRQVQMVLRSFLRFLHMTDRYDRDLSSCLVPFRVWSLSRVPRSVSPEELERAFRDTGGDAHRDLRDRAVLLLLTLYGLRIGEVARLRLEDIDWRAEQLAVRGRKNRRDLILPLVPVVARALARYIKEARPQGTPYREVFLSRYLPHPYANGSLFGMALIWRLRRLGLRFSPHALRHSLARCLMENDCPPEWIQLLLGHVRFSSTQTYAKVDRVHLREVADNEGVGA